MSTADRSSGGIMSETVTCGETVDSRGLSVPSFMSPGFCTYCSRSEGDVSGRLPESPRLTVSVDDEMPRYLLTVIPAESAPCSFHVPPASVAVPVTSSLNSTRISSAETARADDMAGARFCETEMPAPARPLPDASAMSPAEYDRVTSPMGSANADEAVITMERESENAS